MAEELIRIEMIRPDLEQIPQFALPQGYGLKWYEPGFERHWVDIHLAADRYTTFGPTFFAGQFGTDTKLLADRQCYLFERNKRFIGTATAWFVDKPSRDPGLLHWLAIVPNRQGQGLSKPLLSAVLQRMRDLGHQRAQLLTATVRISAINLYQKFGFVPLIRSDEDLQIYSSLQSKLKEPFDLEQVRRQFSK